MEAEAGSEAAADLEDRAMTVPRQRSSVRFGGFPVELSVSRWCGC